MHYQVTHADLALTLALVRGKTLARAAQLLKVDVSTVFRAIHRLEAALGAALFEKGRGGYVPTPAALRLSQQAALAEQALEVAQVSLEQGSAAVSGTVRLTCTDAVLQNLLLPALARFMPDYPALNLELVTSNDFASLTRRDADIALRLTRAAPEHLVGSCLGPVRYQVFASPGYLKARSPDDLAALSWVAPDDFLPDHPTVLWRRQQYPAVVPGYRCNSMLSVAQLVRAGMGVAVLPQFMGDGLRALGEPLPACESALWLLTRPDCRALRSVVTLFGELSRGLRLAPGNLTG